MKVISNTIPAPDEPPKELTEAQIVKITKAMEMLADKMHNPIAITLTHNLRKSITFEEKKKWMVLFFTNCFQVLTWMNMAGEDKRLPEDFEIELKKLFKEKINNGKPR